MSSIPDKKDRQEEESGEEQSRLVTVQHGCLADHPRNIEHESATCLSSRISFVASLMHDCCYSSRLTSVVIGTRPAWLERVQIVDRRQFKKSFQCQKQNRKKQQIAAGDSKLAVEDDQIFLGATPLPSHSFAAIMTVVRRPRFCSTLVRSRN